MQGFQVHIKTQDNWRALPVFFRYQAAAENYAAQFMQGCMEGRTTQGGEKVEVEDWKVEPIEATEAEIV